MCPPEGPEPELALPTPGAQQDPPDSLWEAHPPAGAEPTASLPGIWEARKGVVAVELGPVPCSEPLRSQIAASVHVPSNTGDALAFPGGLLEEQTSSIGIVDTLYESTRCTIL